MQWNWLHLSDLHCGMRYSDWLWPGMERQVLGDLTRLHDVSGPWDFVFFTGDLVQQGHRREFDNLDKLLERLWRHLGRLGSNPCLIAVPGNHDLVRPTGTAADTLISWAKDRAVPDEFWSNHDSAERALVSQAFQNYCDWWRRCPYTPDDVREGSLPGDIAFIAEKDQYRLGVAGLNSTFLQLSNLADEEGNEISHEGRLGLHVSQFRALADTPDGEPSLEDCDVCVLLTHQPPSWLSPDAMSHLRGEIARPGQFALHMFGHMHEPFYTSLREGGSEPRNYWQSMSLFGLESHGEDSNGLQRSHGYSAARLEKRGAETAALTFWPREARRRQDGALHLSPDMTYTLRDDGSTEPVQVKLLNSSGKKSTHDAAARPDSEGVNVLVESGRMGDVDVQADSGSVSVIARKTEMKDIKIVKR